MGYLTISKMLDAIKHITRDNFFFQEDIAQVHCACNTVQSSEKNVTFVFRHFANSAETRVT